MGDAGRVVHRNACPPQQQIGIEHRQPFAEPEAGDGRLRAVVDIAILDRPDGHEVPGMHEFVRRFLDTRVGVARQLLTARTERHRVAMLEPAAVGAIRELKRVLAIRRAAEERDRLMNQAANSGDKCDRVEWRGVGQRPIHDAMGDTTLDEAPLAQVTREDRRVLQHGGATHLLGHLDPGVRVA